MPNPRDELLGVRLAPEWIGQYPVKVRTPDEVIPVDVPTGVLCERYGVPVEICAQIEEWDREFQDAYRPDDPRESGFDNEDTGDRWAGRGMYIARQLATELGPNIPVEIITDAFGAVVVHPGPPGFRSVVT